MYEERLEPVRSSTTFIVLRGRFGRLLNSVIRWRYAFVGGMLALLVATFWTASQRLEFTLFPTQSADELYITVELPSGPLTE